MADLLYCAAEVDTAAQSNCTPIKKKKRLNKRSVYKYPLPLEPSSHLPLSHPSRSSQSTRLTIMQIMIMMIKRKKRAGG